MKYFLIIDFDTKITFDGFRGEDFKSALRDALKDDPEQTGWNPDGLTEFGINAEWVDKKGWVFERGHFDEFVNKIYESYMSRSEVTILDITDPLDVIDIKNV